MFGRSTKNKVELRGTDDARASTLQQRYSDNSLKKKCWLGATLFHGAIQF